MITFQNRTTFDYSDILSDVYRVAQQIEDESGIGGEYLGWRTYPQRYRKTDEYRKINTVAREINQAADAFVVIGVGGSYLGARAVISALTHTYANECTDIFTPSIYYAGKDLSAAALSDLLDVLQSKKSIYLNVISKSGTTLETSIAFRVLRDFLEKRYAADDVRKRIIVTTDGASGALYDEARKNGYRRFIIPDNIGGRYSVLTAVGLLPIAVAGISIDALIDGACAQREECIKDFTENNCLQYAAARTMVYRKGVAVDVFAIYEPKLKYFAEWWKQLFGESEGKEHKGLFPTSLLCTTDLHSLGQYMQEGARIMCETVLGVEGDNCSLHIPKSDSNSDGVDDLVNLSLEEINNSAQRATIAAHQEGGVPVLQLSMNSLSAYNIGAAIYFFEYACAVSAYLLGVNPFDQPGVEVYKKKMRTLLFN